MSSRGIFDGPPITNGPVAVINDAPELVLSDAILKTAYDVVKRVAQHLDQIEALNQSIVNISDIIPVIDAVTVTGSQGLGGGGLLIDNPVLHLDVSTLDRNTDAINKVNDLLAFYHAASGENRSMSVDELKAAVISQIEDLIGVTQGATHLGVFTGSTIPNNYSVKQALQILENHMEDNFASIRLEFVNDLASEVATLNTSINAVSSALNDAVTQITDTSSDLGALDSAYNAFSSSTTTTLNGALASINALSDASATHETDINALTLSVADKASTYALSALDTRVTAAEGELTLQSTRIDDLTTSVDGKADAVALDLLTTRVTATEGVNDVQATSLTFLSASLDDKASASALSSLSATVSDIEGDITAVSNAITSLSAGITPGDVTSALFEMKSVSAPSGWDSRIALQVKGGAGDTFRSAGIFLDTQSGKASRAVIEADQFLVQNGTGAEAPFMVSGGTVYLTNVNIENAEVGNLLVDTINIRPGAVNAAAKLIIPKKVYSRMSPALRWTGSANGTTYTEDIQISPDWVAKVYNPAPSPVMINGNMNFLLVPEGNTPGAGEGKYVLSVILYLEKQAPGGSTWIKVNTLKWSKEYGKGVALQPMTVRKAVSIQDLIIKASDAGLWKYRVRGVLRHKRSTNNFTQLKLWLDADLKFSWAKR